MTLSITFVNSLVGTAEEKHKKLVVAVIWPDIVAHFVSTKIGKTIIR